MTFHFLDALPLDFSRPETRELMQFLSETYFQESRVISMVVSAGISPASIQWGQPSRDLWRDVLHNARNQGRLRVLLEQIASGPDTTVGSRINELLASEPITEAPDATGTVAWPTDSQDSDEEFERQLEAEPTLLDITFLQRGLELAPAVVRLLVTHESERYYGTAFRIEADLLLTNYHVLYPAAGSPATEVEAWFGYERSFGGADLLPTVVRTDPASITGAPEHDWAVIRTIDQLAAAAPKINLFEADENSVKLNDRVYIIQHPFGGVKKIGMIHNVVRYLNDDVIGYRTDTGGGSSGSPVFDEQWRLVGLHHKWETRTVAGRREVLNQGRRIERVRSALLDAGLVQKAS